MNARFPLIHPQFSLSLALLAAASTTGCGSAPPDAPTTTQVSFPDAGTITSDASGALPGFEAGAHEAGALEAGTCPAGHADCDGDPTNGCETNVTTDPKSCGSCGHDCSALPHVSGTGVTCDDGVCVVPASACAAGYGHCSQNADDGCEANLGTPMTCGTCATQCSGATPDCSGGACSDGCAAATPTSCSGSCVDTTSSASNCGTCGNACPAPTYGSATCAASTCGFACNGGHHACGAACADDTSPMTCGLSCTPCAAPAGGTATCTSQGACGFACDSGFHSCDGASCSSNTNTASCGSSCTACAAPASDGSATCDGTSCGIACDSGFHLCGTTSCDSNTSVASCGSSCTPCTAPASNGAATCDGATCGIACDAGYHLCGGNACDANTSLATCGSSCTPCPTPANATPTCNGVACGYTCNSGFADCDGNAANGCEVNLTDDGNNCNACGHSCLGGACASARCLPIVLATETNSSLIAVDGSYVYFSYDSLNQQVGQVSTSGGNVASVSAPSPLDSIAAAAGSVHGRGQSGDVWAVSGAQFNGNFLDVQVTDVSGASNSATQIVTGPPTPVWLDPAANCLMYVKSVPGQLTAADMYNGGSKTITNLAAAPDGFLAWSEGGNAPAVWGGMPTQNPTTLTMTIAPTALADLTTPTSIAVDATYVYVAGNGTILRYSRTGTIAGSEITGDSNVSNLCADGTSVYWTSSGADAILNESTFGSGVNTIVSGTHVTRVACDAVAVYWTNATTGEVEKVAK